MAASAKFIVGAKRTAFGSFGGSLKNVSAIELGTIASKAALAQAGLAPEAVDSSVWGCVIQSSQTAGPYMARHVALKAGCDNTTPSLTVNRLCGSGFQSVISAIHEMNDGDAEIALTGGAENMSQAPFALRNMRFGATLGVDPVQEDTLWKALQDEHVGVPMAITAENLAEQHSISKEECDAFAARSQQTWGLAAEAGAFDAEIAPVEVKGRKGPAEFAVDEHPRPESTAESVGRLPALFKKGGTVSAGNASGICDGAAAIVVATGAAVEKHQLSPLARVVSYHVSGVDPLVMGIGPVPAMHGALAKAGLTLDDMDLVEINEAFAAQYLACEKELGLERERTNVHGGAISLGHPVGASGARITAHLAHQLGRLNKRYAIGAACIGGGQGIAIVLENAAA